MKSAYVNFALVVQALRRDVERRRSALCSAIGIRAELYPHQLANVQRILAAEEVRHLLADEVGLGKTVQALMVVNALRLQRPDLRVMILVPDQLVPQWRDEILSRAHVAPIERAPGPDEVRRIRLAWPSKVTSTEITARDYDLLIVDELQRLTLDLQDRVVHEAPRFRHLLILTATPNFRASARHVQLFAALEPARVALACAAVASSDRGHVACLADEPEFTKWPDWALSEVVAEITARDSEVARLVRGEDEDWDNYGGEPPIDDMARAAALAHCAYRRVIRTRRKDYRGVVPQRVHRPVVVEPTYGEARREQLMWRYFAYLSGLSRDYDEVKLAKRVILSAPSLRQRVSFLRRKGHEREGILGKVTELLSDDHGDARLDALTDLLAEIWRNDPTERVLVAAQDTLTVDYLFKVIPARLPQIGPSTGRVDLVPACVRQGMTTEAVEDLGGFGNETNVNLEAFQRGAAQVLFAPETVQVGLNLQCARILVLYSVPWGPEEVEQWIGRLDRIGNTAVQSEDGEIRSVEVYTIVERGLVDEKVVTVLECFRVFDQNINLDGEHLQEIADSIQAAALQQNGMNWTALERQAEEMAKEDSAKELVSDLRPMLPWGVQHARRVRDWMQGLAPAPGAIRVSQGRTGPDAWDRAVDGWTWLLSKAGEYKIYVGQTEPDDPDSRFSSIWYTYGERLPFGAGKAMRSRVWLGESSGVDNPQQNRHPQNAVAFFTRRKEIKQPPRREVCLPIGDEKYRRKLHFLNHGDPLHEDLVSGWLQVAREIPRRFAVCLPRNHKSIEIGGTGVYVLRVAVVDPADCLPPPAENSYIGSALGASRLLTPERLVAVLGPLVDEMETGIEADVRWLREILPTMLQISALRLDDDQWVPPDEGFVEAILNPYATESDRPPISQGWRPPTELERKIRAGLGALAERHEMEAKNAWSSHYPVLDREINLRAYVVTVDGQDAAAVRRAEMADAGRKLDAAKASDIRLSIARADAAYRAAADIAAVGEAACTERRKWLQATGAAARKPKSLACMEFAFNLVTWEQ